MIHIPCWHPSGNCQRTAICAGTCGLTPTTPPAPDALPDLPNAIRVPIHRIWADAGYLVGRAIAGDKDLAVHAIKALCDEAERAIRAALASQAEKHAAELAKLRQPIDMVPYCPNCGMPHVDEPEDEREEPIHEGPEVVDTVIVGWDNPPHRLHMCHGCGTIWRPADVPTNGVAEIKTKGKADSPVRAAAREALSVQPTEPVALIAAAVERVRNTIIVEGESPEKLREAIALRVADMGKQTFALPQPAPSVPAVTEEMVNRFLGWRLPEDFYPDGGVSFAREVNGGPRPRDWWPTGTNLLTAEQARAMLAHVIAAAPNPAARADELAKLRQWRVVADDMLTVFHEVASDDPRESIDRLINWHVQVALDPAVSSDAAALVEVGRQQGAKLRQGEPVAGWRLLKDTTYAERSWPEDASHENGCYSNTCCHCGRAFTGHKRRPSCKACSAASTPPSQPPRKALQPLSDEKSLREKFEAWMVNGGKHPSTLYRTPAGEYEDDTVASRWRVWQAAHGITERMSAGGSTC